jgi:pyrroline-5-carboxylate reductase
MPRCRTFALKVYLLEHGNALENHLPIDLFAGFFSLYYIPLIDCGREIIMENTQVGIIGCGTMGGAILRALLAHEFENKDLLIIERIDKTREEIGKKYKVQTSSTIENSIGDCNVIIIAVKPQNIDEVLKELSPHLSEKNLLLSVAAGITTAYIERRLGEKWAVSRTMPNIAAQVGEAATAICFNKVVNREQKERAKDVMGNIGLVVEVDEKHMDAVTGLSGSGPAYIFLMVEALAEGGVLIGLPREKAFALAIQTVYGTACLLRETGEHPAVLKEMVTTPGGTTAEGLLQLESGRFRHIIISAVQAAAEKSRILGENLH